MPGRQAGQLRRPRNISASNCRVRRGFEASPDPSSVHGRQSRSSKVVEPPASACVIQKLGVFVVVDVDLRPQWKRKRRPRTVWPSTTQLWTIGSTSSNNMTGFASACRFGISTVMAP